MIFDITVQQKMCICTMEDYMYLYNYMYLYSRRLHVVVQWKITCTCTMTDYMYLFENNRRLHVVVQWKITCTCLIWLHILYYNGDYVYRNNRRLHLNNGILCMYLNNGKLYIHTITFSYKTCNCTCTYILISQLTLKL